MGFLAPIKIANGYIAPTVNNFQATKTQNYIYWYIIYICTLSGRNVTLFPRFIQYFIDLEKKYRENRKPLIYKEPFVIHFRS